MVWRAIYSHPQTSVQLGQKAKFSPKETRSLLGQIFLSRLKKKRTLHSWSCLNVNAMPETVLVLCMRKKAGLWGWWEIKAEPIWILDGTAELLSQRQQTPNFRFLVMREEKSTYYLIYYQSDFFMLFAPKAVLSDTTCIQRLLCICMWRININACLCPICPNNESLTLQGCTN